MTFRALRLHWFAGLGATLLLGACGAQSDGLAPPYVRQSVLAAGVASSCTADDLAVADSFAPLVDDASSVVATEQGEPICLAPAAVALAAARNGRDVAPDHAADAPLGPPPSWATDGNVEELTGDNPGQTGPAHPHVLLTPTGIVQDPTPQPARPGDSGPKDVTPSPTPSNGSSKN